MARKATKKVTTTSSEVKQVTERMIVGRLSKNRELTSEVIAKKMEVK